MSGDKISIMLVDDHDVVRRGLNVFLRAFSAEMELVGEASNGEEAILLAEKYQPDVIIMDIQMPTMGGIEATRKIKSKFPFIQVIALTSSREEEYVTAMLQAGATSYMLKSVTPNDLAAAIRASREGRPTLAPEATQALINAANRPQKPNYDLTDRELEVLGWMVKGMTNPEIADKLTVSLATVKYHISSVLGKMNVSSRTEAVALAVEHKLTS
jgi:two-component system, NarL family, response regulator LiaR